MCLDYPEGLSLYPTFGAESSSGKADSFFLFFFLGITTKQSMAWGPAYESFRTDKAEFKSLLCFVRP